MPLRLIKALVIAMSVALVLGFVVLMVGLAFKARELGTAADAPPFAATLDLPEGAAVITISGAGDRLAVLVEHAGGRREIRFVDPETGAVIGIVAAE